MLGSPARTLSPDAVREIRHGYLANISYFDAQLGKVLEELDRLGFKENTVIVLWGDHGYHLGEQTLWAKTSNFELDARVPLLVAAPTLTAAGAKTDALAELLDLYPTLVELCGLPLPPGLAGRSLVPVLKDPKASVKAAALTQHPRPAYYDRYPSKTPVAMGYSVRTDGFRYTEWRDWSSGEITACELYNHRVDPDETRNLAEDAKYSTDVRSCASALEAFQPIVRPGWKPVIQPRKAPP
jgi:iduronate 2-sulfatase